MRIWIDGYEANVPQRLGSGQVAFQLLKSLEKLDQNNEYTILLPSEPMSDFPPERVGWRYRILKPHRLWTRIALPLALFSARKKPDLFFTPTHYGPWKSPVKNIITIFDLAFLHFPLMFPKTDLYKLENWTRSSVQKAGHIITISESTKTSIVDHYHQPKRKITVAYPGYNNQLNRPVNDQKKIDAIKEKYGVEGKYILFVGTVQPRKNLKRLIEAFKKIENVKLVVVGKTSGEGRQGWMYEEILALPKELGIEHKIIFAGFVPDEELVYLMNGATAYALPSLWEGFGIPVVDAMACGIPVIVSNISSLPEVVGKAGLQVDPKSVDQIEQAIRLISTDKKLWQKQVKLGLEQAKQFSWEKMAKKVLHVFEKVVEDV